MGLYHGSKKHEPDLLNVLSRAWDAGLKKIIITGGNLEDSEKALNLAKTEGKIVANLLLYIYSFYEIIYYGLIISRKTIPSPINFYFYIYMYFTYDGRLLFSNIFLIKKQCL